MQDIDIAQILAILFYASLVIFYLFFDPWVSVALILTIVIVGLGGWWDQRYQEEKEKRAAAYRARHGDAENEAEEHRREREE